MNNTYITNFGYDPENSSIDDLDKYFQDKSFEDDIIILDRKNYCDELSLLNSENSEKKPPKGRSQKQHNFITNLNKKRF